MQSKWLFLVIFWLWVAGGALVGVQQASAQEQFFTQSGGRGLQNAKTNARLTKAETDIGVIQEDLKTIQPHARAQLGNCANVGEKLRYDGRNWICEKETDPTVKGFAKKDLPTCSGGNILGVSGGDLSCVASGFVTNEADPTVQPYAKAPLPSCGSEQLLSVANGALVCRTDQQGITGETDPRVHNFARRDIVSALPNCGSNEVLTMVGGMLTCKVDSVGITTETDPLVQPFARTDNGEPALTACAAGQVLNAVTSGSQTVLNCVAASSVLSGLLNLDDLGDVNTAGVTSGTVLTYSAGEWRALPGLGTASNPINLSQLGDVQLSTPATDQLLRFDGTRWVNSDDRVASMTDTNWCHVVSGRIVCDRPAPLMCSATEALSWNTTTNTWVCNDLGASIGQTIALNALIDVTITTPLVGQSLLYDGSGWANSTLNRIMAGDSQVVVTDSGSDGLISFATEGQTHMAITNQGRVGVGVMPSSPYMMDISGSTRVAGDLMVTGNLNISGSQSIDGVIFANGGIEMPGTLTSGNVSVTNLSATLADIRTLRTENVSTSGNLSVVGSVVGGSGVFGPLTASDLTATSTTLNRLVVDTTGLVRGDLTIGGNLYVSGSQSIDGVLFANGGITMNGTVTSGNISATNLSATLADIRTLRVNNNVDVGGVLTAPNISATNNLTVGNAFTALTGGIGTLASTNLTATSGTLGNVVVDNDALVRGTLTVRGNLNVSGSQSLDGVLFANGGIQMPGNFVGGAISATNISASGNISANQFIGDGSRLTGVTAASADWYSITNIPTQVQAVSNSGAIVMAGISSTNISVTDNATIGGALTAASAGFGPVNATTLTASNQVSTSRISVTTLQLGLADQCVGASDAGKIRYSGGVLQVCDGTGWDSLITNASTADRITSGTTNVIARTDGSISFTTAGVTTGYFYNGQLVAQAVSTTGIGRFASISSTGNVSGDQGIFNSLTGTLQTAAQPNITSLGSLTSLTVTGDSVLAAISATNISATGNISANRFIGDGSQLTNINASSVVGYAGDRISSTNNQAMVVATPAGTVSLTLGGVAGVAYFDPTLGLVVNSISTTSLARFASVSATGNISANQFIGAFVGDGSQLTNLSLGSLQAAGVVGSVQFKGASNEISGTNTLLVNSGANRADLTVSGTVKVAGDGSEACSSTNHYGQMRFVQDAGRMVMQICRP